MMQRIYSSVVIILFFLSQQLIVFSQGVGNHLTISMENCAQTANTITFDIFIVSDGAAGSDLRLNSAQFGINYDSCFIPSGGTLNLSYIASSSDFIPVLNTFSFPVS